MCVCACVHTHNISHFSTVGLTWEVLEQINHPRWWLVILSTRLHNVMAQQTPGTTLNSHSFIFIKNILQVDQMFTQQTHQKTTCRNQIQLLYFDNKEVVHIICNIQGTSKEMSWDTRIGGRIILKGCCPLELHRMCQ
jgi:hypothetical protein